MKRNSKGGLFFNKEFPVSEAFLNMAADDEADLAEFDRSVRLNDRFGPCEDDYELTAPFVDMLPEESYDKEGPSPLRF